MHIKRIENRLDMSLFPISDADDIVLHTVINEPLLQTTISICRALSRLESHVLLAGPTGSDKIEALHIACTYMGIKFVSITPVKNFNMNDFYNDLKMVRIELA